MTGAYRMRRREIKGGRKEAVVFLLGGVPCCQLSVLFLVLRSVLAAALGWCGVLSARCLAGCWWLGSVRLLLLLGLRCAGLVACLLSVGAALFGALSLAGRFPFQWFGSSLAGLRLRFFLKCCVAIALLRLVCPESLS